MKKIMHDEKDLPGSLIYLEKWISSMGELYMVAYTAEEVSLLGKESNDRLAVVTEMEKLKGYMKTLRYEPKDDINDVEQFKTNCLELARVDASRSLVPSDEN